MKAMTDYATHNNMNLDEGFDALPEYAESALLAAWDGCHKIYLAMDEEQRVWFRENYDYTTEDLIELHVVSWWQDSCPLRFVQAVWTNDEDPNAGFFSVIAQGASNGDDEEDDEED
jgi:hypothetical protein